MWWLQRPKFSNLSVSNIDLLVYMLQLYISKNFQIGNHSSKIKQISWACWQGAHFYPTEAGYCKSAEPHGKVLRLRDKAHPGCYTLVELLTTQKSYVMKLKTPSINCHQLRSVPQEPSMPPCRSLWKQSHTNLFPLYRWLALPYFSLSPKVYIVVVFLLSDHLHVMWTYNSVLRKKFSKEKQEFE